MRIHGVFGACLLATALALGCNTSITPLIGTSSSGSDGTTGSGTSAGSGTSSGTGTSNGTSGGSGCGSASGACPGEVPLDHRPVPVGCDGGIPDGGSECWQDADCDDAGFGAPGLCSCAPNTRHGFSASANICIPNDCRVDADCACGYCSPTVNPNCGSFYGVQGYYCHTPQDCCVNDSDCDGGGGYCAYHTEVGYWTCGYGHCAG
jgi:hypothetical protein